MDVIHLRGKTLLDKIRRLKVDEKTPGVLQLDEPSIVELLQQEEDDILDGEASGGNRQVK